MSSADPSAPPPENLPVHGLIMIVLVLLMSLAQTVLGLCAIMQFFWMLLAKERNPAIGRFGEGLANWLGTTARFLSGAADERPFPWTEWR